MCASVAFVVNLAAEPDIATFLGYIPALAGIGVAIAFARRGYISVAAHVLVGLCYVAISGAALWTGGLSGGAPHVIGIVLVLGAMVLPSRSVVALVAGGGADGGEGELRAGGDRSWRLLDAGLLVRTGRARDTRYHAIEGLRGLVGDGV